MKESGLTNAFEDREGGWVCVKESEVVKAAPDAIIVVDAAWDTAMSKIEYLYDHNEFCTLEALTQARLVKIPFSATPLSPRNGPAALDLATASLEVRFGIRGDLIKSGVSFFDIPMLKEKTKEMKCTVSDDAFDPKDDADISVASSVNLSVGAF